MKLWQSKQVDMLFSESLLRILTLKSAALTSIPHLKFYLPFYLTWAEGIKWAIVIAHRRSSVSRPSDVRPANYHIIEIVLWNRWTAFIYRKQYITPSTSFVSFGPIGKTRCCSLASDWLTHFWLLFWNPWTECQKLVVSKSHVPEGSLCNTGWSEKQDDRPGLWLADNFWLLLWNPWTECQKLDSKQDLRALYLVMCFSGSFE